MVHSYINDIPFNVQKTQLRSQCLVYELPQTNHTYYYTNTLTTYHFSSCFVFSLCFHIYLGPNLTFLERKTTSTPSSLVRWIPTVKPSNVLRVWHLDVLSKLCPFFIGDLTNHFWMFFPHNSKAKHHVKKKKQLYE